MSSYPKRTLAVLLAFTSIAAGQTFLMRWYTIDGGGEYSAGGDFELEGAIGQHDAGPGTFGMTGGDFTLVGGFWPGAAETVVLPGDCNGDGNVGPDDYAGFTACMLGPGSMIGQQCACFDLDDSGTVDLGDAADLLVLFTGP